MSDPRAKKLIDMTPAELRERIVDLTGALTATRAVLRAADDDIREHLQVARYNLTGMMHTGDQCPIPNPPLLIHADGIAKSERVRAQIRDVLTA